MSEWISIDERAPSENVEVLCTDLQDVFIASRHSDFFTSGEHELQYVTHWMPLPKPPTA